MARNRNKKSQNARNNVQGAVQSSSQDQELSSVSLTLRLPGRAARSARLCSEEIGISFNGLICIALSDYLQSKGYSVSSVKN